MASHPGRRGKGRTDKPISKTFSPKRSHSHLPSPGLPGRLLPVVMERKPRAEPRRQTWRCTAQGRKAKSRTSGWQIAHSISARSARLTFSKTRPCSPRCFLAFKFSQRPSHPHAPGLNEILSSWAPLRTHILGAAEEVWPRCFLAALSGITSHSDTRAWTHLLCLPKLVLRFERRGKQNSKRSSNGMRRTCEQWVEGAQRILLTETTNPSERTPSCLLRQARQPGRRASAHNTSKGASSQVSETN